MSDSSDSKKGIGLTGLVVALLIVLIAQTGWLIKLQLDARAQAPDRKVRAEAAAAQRPAAVTRPQAPRSADPYWGAAVPGLDEWDPFREMEQMRRSMDRLFRDSFQRGMSRSGLVPSLIYNPDVDLRETDSEYVVRLDLPGIDKDKISVKVQNGMLVLSGERSAENEQSSEDGAFYRTERSFGSFVRSFPLPPDADAQKMTAESKNGVLTVHIPKSAERRPADSSIPVQ